MFVDPDGMAAVGADGLTNEQWMETSRPGTDPGLATAYKNENRKVESNGDPRKAKSGGGGNGERSWLRRQWDKLFGSKKHNTVEAGPIESTPAQTNYANGFNSYLSNKFLNNFSFDDAIWHYRLGNGAPVNINLSSLDFSSVKVSDFDTPEFIYEGAPGIWVRFDNKKDYVNPSQALIYGTVDVVYIGNNRIMVLPNTYDFDLKLEKGSLKRDFATMMGAMYNGSVTPYVIYFNGTTKISD